MRDDVGINDLIELLNKEVIQYCVIRYEQSVNELEVLIHLDSNKKFIKTLKANGYVKEGSSTNKYSFIYRLEPDVFWISSLGLKIHSACQLSCVSLSNLSKCKLPLDNLIQSSVWENKIWDESKQYWKISEEDYLIYVLTKCIFDQKKFDEKSIEWLSNHKECLESDTLNEKLKCVFFLFTPELIQCIRKDNYAEVIKKYRTFHKY